MDTPPASLSDLTPALQARWDGAAYQVDMLVAGLGAPTQIAGPHVFRLLWRQVLLFRDWLGHVEAYLRRVLLLTALALIAFIAPSTDKARRPRATKPPPQSNLDRWHDVMTPLQHECVDALTADTS